MSLLMGVLVGGSVRAEAGAGRLRRLVAFVLVAGGCVLAGPLVAPARAPAAIGNVTNYTSASIRNPVYITTGPDGALWWTNFLGDSLGFLDPKNPADIGNLRSLVGGIRSPAGIAVGPSIFGTSVLWFTNIGNNTVANADQIIGDPSINAPSQIVAGPDGAMWFTNTGNSRDPVPGSIGRVTVSGALTNYSDPTINAPTGIAAGPDGALWFTNQVGFRSGGSAPMAA
jgi:virginiamycin B lyase